MLKAIETIYSGYRFRSRLEARWAVFFDTLGVRYEYEPEGFELGDGLRYLPDFWLPVQDVWIEIKPTVRPESNEWLKCAALARSSGKEVCLFDHTDFARPVYDTSTAFSGAWGRIFRPDRNPGDDEDDGLVTWMECIDCEFNGTRDDGSVVIGTDQAVRCFISDTKDENDHVSWHGWDPSEFKYGFGCDDTVALVRAYRAARSARFEFDR